MKHVVSINGEVAVPLNVKQVLYVNLNYGTSLQCCKNEIDLFTHHSILAVKLDQTKSFFTWLKDSQGFC